MTHIQARTSTEAFWTLDPFAVVEPGDPWFVDLEQLLPREHYGVAHRIARHLGASAARPEFVHLALLGHAGLGKTTLARAAIASLAGEGLTPIYIDALQGLDQADFGFSDLLLVAAEAVIGQLVERELVLGRAQLESVHTWLVEELLAEPHRTQLLGAGEAELTIAAVASIAAKITAALKSDHDYRRELRRRAERDPRSLIRSMNGLLDAVHEAIKPGQLCLVFSNLEKTRLDLVDRALLQRAGEFRQLRCHSMLFCSPASEYAPVGVRPSNAFTCVTVPALPVRFAGDAAYVVRPEAVAAIEALLRRRLDLDAIFEDPSACVESLAHWSGGHLRDLLQLARRAVENLEPGKVGVEDIEQAARWLGASLSSSLHPEDFPRAVELHRAHRVSGTEQDRRMLASSSVLLQYDSTHWWDVHPAVRADPLFLEAQALLRRQ